MTSSTFRGRVGAWETTDPELFASEVKAKNLVAKHPYTPQTLNKRAYGEPPVRLVLSDMERAWLGQGVHLADGRAGQVWALSSTRNYVWVVLPGQQVVSVHTEDLRATGLGTVPQGVLL